MKILIIKPSSLGDAIHAAPVVASIKKYMPEAKISWLVNTAFADLVAMIANVDEIITFDRKSWTNPSLFFSNAKKLFALSKLIRDKNFDITIDLQGLFRSGFFSYISGARRRLGFDNAREFATFFYSEKISVRGQKLHAVDANMKIMSYLFPNENLPVEVDFKFILRAKDFNALSNRFFNGKMPDYCVLCPSARWESKKWPAEYYATLGELVTKQGLKVIITGDNSDAEFWKHRSNGNLISLCGQTNLTELALLIAGAKYVVTNDSGPMHLAVALNKQVFTVMGPTDPKKTGPYRNAEVLTANIDCVPCFKRECVKKDTPCLCMKSITPQQMFLKIEAHRSKLR